MGSSHSLPVVLGGLSGLPSKALLSLENIPARHWPPHFFTFLATLCWSFLWLPADHRSEATAHIWQPVGWIRWIYWVGSMAHVFKVKIAHCELSPSRTSFSWNDWKLGSPEQGSPPFGALHTRCPHLPLLPMAQTHSVGLTYLQPSLLLPARSSRPGTPCPGTWFVLLPPQTDRRAQGGAELP